MARVAATRLMVLLCALALLSACAGPSPSAPVASPDRARADAVLKIVRDTLAQRHLKSVIVRVTVDAEEVMTQAVGESMTGVPATPQMHFRNGAVAISYVSTLLLELVDEKKVRLDDKLAKWLPDFPNADRVTLGQLAQMTSGYPDYVLGNDAFSAALYANPFKQWTVDDILAQIRSRPLLYPPGSNWNYAHTNYILLGLALEKATGQSMPTLLNDKVLRPLGLSQTADSNTPEIPSPVLHAFSSERREALEIPPGTPFYEDTTYWNPSWTITHGAIETTDIADLTASAIAIGEGSLLSSESHQAMVSTDLRGFGSPIEGYPTCFQQGEAYSYGVGLVTTGDWVMQNPMFAGQAAAMAYLAAGQVSIAVAVTFEPEAFDADGNTRNEADQLFRELGAIVAPDHAPPIRR